MVGDHFKDFLPSCAFKMNHIVGSRGIKSMSLRHSKRMVGFDVHQSKLQHDPLA